MKKKKLGNTKLLIIAVVMTFVVMFGTTYAWLRLTKTSTIENKITAGNLELVLDDTTSEGIKLEKAVPISDVEGEKGTEYTFTLENKGTIDLNYYLYLNDLDLAEGETRLEDNKVRYKLVKDDNVVTATNVGMYRIIYVEGNYTIDFDPQTHKISRAVYSNGSSINGLPEYINSQLTETSTFDDAYKIVKKAMGDNATLKVTRQRNSDLLSTTETKDGRMIDMGQINSKQKITYKLQIWIDSHAETEVMGKIFNARLNLAAEQKNISTKALCRKAKTLHTETCKDTTNLFGCSGDGYAVDSKMKTTTITYGNLGKKGRLKGGDAFDCDVNGDGVYDAETERFYYVSDLTDGTTVDSNTAVLIYYSNVAGGVPSNTVSAIFNDKVVSGTEYYTTGHYGPETAIKQLPTSEQWSNVKLANAIRTIRDENGTVMQEGFSYEGYAARLLSVQEVNLGCGTTIGETGAQKRGELSTKCKYLMENTDYYYSDTKNVTGEWLENIYSHRLDLVYYVHGRERSVDSSNANGIYNPGVRPAIEVAKENIEY